MEYQNPTAGRATDSATEASPVGDLPPLPRESVVYGGTESDNPSMSPLDAFQERLEEMADDVLEKATIELGRSINAAHAQFAMQVREVDRRGNAEFDHGLSTAQWLATYCQMSGAEASGTVKTAWAMAHMPTVSENALTGAVPRRSVQLLGQARDRNPDDFAENEATFGEAATDLSIKDLRHAIEEWEQRVNYSKALENVKHHETLRSLYLTQMVDGMGDLQGTLPPELFHTVDTALRSIVNPTFLGDDDPRTFGQRRADALGEVCRFYLDHNTDVVTSGGERPHITVTVDYETLKGQSDRLPEIGGMPVSPETLRRITCDAAIIPMVLGSDSEPLDVGRKTRTIPAAIRRALEQRDRGCTWDGCDAPISWCDAHHLRHWADGGDTSLGNLRLLCRKHHTATHNGRTPPPDI